MQITLQTLDGSATNVYDSTTYILNGRMYITMGLLYKPSKMKHNATYTKQK